MPPRHPQDGLRVRAIGYIRVSKAREEMISPAIQRASITDWARRNGRDVVRWLRDLDNTGRNFARKEVMAGIAGIEAGEAAEILVYRYDRWGRNVADAMANIVRVERAGGLVASTTEPFDAQTAIGRYSRTNALALAEMQSDIIGENWRDALSSRVARGLPATGNARFGYQRLGRVPDPFVPHRYHRDPEGGGERYVPDPVTGPVLADVYGRYIAGTGATRLLAVLNGQGITTLRGDTWGTKTLMGVLDSGFAAGLLRIHDPGCHCGQPFRCRQVTYLPGAHEALISPETWQGYLARRARARDVPSYSRTPAYPLTGLMRCGTCSGILVAAFANGQPGYAYRCNNWVQHKGCPGVWVRRSLAEQAVLDRLREVSSEAAQRAAARQARARLVTDAEAAKTRLAADLAEADRELRRLVKLAASDTGIPDQVFGEARSDLLARRSAAETALARVTGTAQRNGGEYLPVARDLLRLWDLIPAPRRRDMLLRVVSRVVVTRTGRRTPAKIEVIMIWEETAE